MKKLNYISALLCAAALIGSCSNEELLESGTATQGEMSLIATTGVDTRTAVDEGYNVKWSNGDEFYAFGGKVEKPDNTYYKATGKFVLQKGAGTTTGTFKSTMKGNFSDLEYAVYPLSAYTSDTKVVTFPTTYTYPNSNAPMFGKIDTKNAKVSFNQLLSGLIRIEVSVIGIDEKEGTLELAAKGITGEATLSIDNGGNATLGAVTGGTDEDKVTISFPITGTNPMLLDIPVPASTYTNGITATLKIGEATKDDVFKTESSFEVGAGTVKVMPAISVVAIDGSTIKFADAVVESVTEANAALKEENVKSITIKNVTGNNNEIAIPASSTQDAPVTINLASADENAEIKVTGTDETGNQAVVINAPTDSKGTLKVEKVEHVEISGGNWTKVTASTGDSTLDIQSGTVINELVIEKGAVKIASDAEVKKMMLNADATLKEYLYIAEGKSMEINVGNHTLTMEGTRDHGINGTLKLTGTNAESKGHINDNATGLYLIANGAKLEMENIEYTATRAGANGIVINEHIKDITVKVENCKMTSKYFCFSTNASVEVGSGNTITFNNSTFIAEETPLMLNIPATLTATNCTFTGGWQAAFLRGGTSSFSGCAFTLDVKSSYGASNITAGSASWSQANQAPSAAITIGNRGGAYDYPKNVTLQNSCTFSVKKDNVDSKGYPAIYIDANPNQTSQTVSFTYDEGSKTSFEKAGTGLDIRNTTGQVTVNGVVYKGPTVE